MMKKIQFKVIMIKFLFIFVLVLSLISNNFSYNIIAEENEQIILPMDISFTPSIKRNENNKLETGVVKLLDKSQDLGDLNKYELNKFDFVNDKVRLEIILTNEVCLDQLTNFDKNVVVECHYENLAQVLVPIDLIRDLSEETFIQFIRNPGKIYPLDITSEGVGVIDADLVHDDGYYGEGVKIAIIDIGFTDYDINPELPSERIKEVKSFRSDGQVEVDEHGSACAEIVLDVSPSANLYLYVVSTLTEFCSAINYSVSKGVDIISISLGMYNQNDLDGTGVLCSVVNNARSSGVLLMIAAGNSAESHYCGWYVDDDDDYLHDFDTGNNFLILDYYPGGYTIDLYLSWNDWPYSDQDYDLYLLDGYGNTIGYSENVQSGSQPPTEWIYVDVPYDDYYYVYIQEYDASSSVRFQLFSDNCYFYDNKHPETSLSCPADASGSMTVGATDWINDDLENFSSRGPTNDGRKKPDVTAPDNVSTWTYAPYSFPGTSASTPHVAGAAALLKSVDTSLTANNLQNILESTALDLGSGGKDNLYGSGRINVWDAYNTINKPPVANNDSYNVDEDDTLNIASPGILANDTDLDDDPLSATLEDDVSHGTLTLSSDGSFSYTPDLHYFGTDNFTYKAYDGDLYSNIAKVTITIISENDAPVAIDDYYNVDEDTILTVSSPGILVNDTDVENDPLTAILMNNPTNGQITAFSGDGSFSYKPIENFSGSDSFSYKANDGDLDSNEAIVYLTVDPINDAPLANFTYAPLNPNTLDIIQFTDISTDIDGTVVSWLWDFGDGNTSSLQNPTHQYGDDGTYSVTLTVTDDGSATDDYSLDIFVSIVFPTADFTYTPSIPTPLELIQFNDTSFDLDGTIISWLWNFGDGNTSNEQNPSKFYSQGGTYTINLNITDDDELTNETYQNILINTYPYADFSYNPLIPETYENILFIDLSVDPYGPIVSWYWEFGDGNTSTEQNPIHQYVDNGTYTVILNVTDEYGLTNETSQNINIKNVKPIVEFTYLPVSPTDLDNITFIDNSIDTDGNIIYWYWEFGDEDNSTEQNPTHQYADDGTYMVTLNVTDDDGDKNETAKFVIVRNVPPIANYTFIPYHPEINEIVQFTDTSFDLDGTITSWLWNFGDGNTSTLQNPQNTYSSFKTYIVTLNATDDDGDKNETSMQIITKTVYKEEIEPGEETVDFMSEGDTNISINVTDSTNITFEVYSGNPSYENIPSNISSIDKYVDISVENESAIVWPIQIKIYYTQDDLFNSGIEENQLLGLYFWNNSADEWQLYKDIGVNISYNQSGYEGYCWANVWHLTPLTIGGDIEPPLKVTGLSVSDAKDGKLDLKWNTAIDNFDVDNYKIYRDGIFLINKTTTSHRDTGLTNGKSYSYQVSAVDLSGNEGEKSDSKSGTPTASSSDGGDSGGGGIPFIPPLSQNIFPRADAGGPYYGFIDEEIEFDGSKSTDDGTITNFTWDFGDKTAGYGVKPSHVYTKPGRYKVILTVTDDLGAINKDETVAEIAVPNKIPSAPFVDGAQEGTQNTEYSFTAVSTDGDNDTIQYHFDWGDGTTNITEFLPNGTPTLQMHIWTAAGKYTINVQAHDNKTPSEMTSYRVLIDTHIVENIGYITDDDEDGTYDTFHGENIDTDLGFEGGKYLIDTTGDGNWNYTYGLVEGLAIYKKEVEEEIPLIIVVGIIVLIVILAIIVAIFKKRK